MTADEARARIQIGNELDITVKLMTADTYHRIQREIAKASVLRHSCMVTFPELYSMDHLRQKEDGDYPPDCETLLVDKILDDAIAEIKKDGFKVKKLAYKFGHDNIDDVPTIVVTWFPPKK